MNNKLVTLSATVNLNFFGSQKRVLLPYNREKRGENAEQRHNCQLVRAFVHNRLALIFMTQLR